MNALKLKTIQELEKKIEEQIQFSFESMEMLVDSRNNETKSSAGDKFETGREMLQAEINKAEFRHSHLLHLKEELQKAKRHSHVELIEAGSFVNTSNGYYYISIPFGKLELGKDLIYVVSADSPVALALIGKKSGQKVKFMNKEIKIKSVD